LIALKPLVLEVVGTLVAMREVLREIFLQLFSGFVNAVVEFVGELDFLVGEVKHFLMDFPDMVEYLLYFQFHLFGFKLHTVFLIIVGYPPISFTFFEKLDLILHKPVHFFTGLT
jgi:hypothetical protein